MKEQLVALIEAFAAAKATNNALLVQFAAQQLSSFLDAIDVSAKPQPGADYEDGGQE
jgi:hypothetical protein